MPRYTYHCKKCDNYYDISHAMTESVDLPCVECAESLVKVPSVPLSLKVREIDSKTGEIVKSSIEEFRRDLKDQRAEASKKEI